MVFTAQWFTRLFDGWQMGQIDFVRRGQELDKESHQLLKQCNKMSKTWKGVDRKEYNNARSALQSYRSEMRQGYSVGDVIKVDEYLHRIHDIVAKHS